VVGDTLTSRRGRVLCLTSNLPRWAGDSTTPFVLHLAADLRALGWEVECLAPHAEGAAVREELDGVPVERFRYLWPPSAQTVCYSGGALVNLRRSRANQAKLPALVAAEWASVARRVARGRYDLVHAHWLLPQGLVASAPPRRTPVVVTAHGGDVFGLPGRLLARAKRLALERADAVTANSSFTDAALRRLAPGLGAVSRIPMGVDTTPPDPDEVEAVRARHLRGDGPLVVFAGRLVEEKGVDDLLRALAALGGRCPDSTALVLGDGQDRAALEGLATALGLDGRVTFTGWAAPGTVAAALAAGDVVAAPSREGPDGWVEAQGLTVVEAMAAGTPVVATRSGGVGDAVVDGDTGLLVDERSPDQLAAAIERLATDQVLAARCVAQGRRVAEDRFSRRTTAEAFSALFERVLQARRVGGRPRGRRAPLRRGAW
jgi:phosphatidylinositol alpha-1,6-mannosyltransferase